MPRTRLLCLDVLLGALVCMAGASCTAAPMAVTCTLSVPAQLAVGKPAPLQLNLTNTGTEAVDVLVWGTPFEANWFASYVTVLRGDVALKYGGASMKRGDPAQSQYLRIAAGQARIASADMATAFDLSVPGRYRVQSKIVLHDVIVVGPADTPRPRDQHVSLVPDCNAVDFDVVR